MRITTNLFFTTSLIILLVGTGCAGSQWKVHGGPAECQTMCADWNMQLAGMVGVGNQDRQGGGASACVCEVVSAAGANAATGATGTSSALSAAVVAMEQALRQEQEQQQQQQW